MRAFERPFERPLVNFTNILRALKCFSQLFSTCSFCFLFLFLVNLNWPKNTASKLLVNLITGFLASTFNLARYTIALNFQIRVSMQWNTGGPRYIREIGTPKIGLHITNLHIKRPRITVNKRIGSRKKAISGLHICKITDKKTAYNEGCLYYKTKKLRGKNNSSNPPPFLHAASTREDPKRVKIQSRHQYLLHFWYLRA